VSDHLHVIDGGRDKAGRMKAPDSPWPFGMTRQIDGRLFGVEVSCRDWDEALAIAAKNGWAVVGPIYARGTIPRWMPDWLFSLLMSRKLRRIEKMIARK